VDNIEPDVLNQVQLGNQEAFTQLVETYQRPVYNLCYRMLGSSEEAEDASQETFLRVYKNIKRYDHKRPFSTWLLSIAHHCIDQLRNGGWWSFQWTNFHHRPAR
jgi:RNA polymerase sigma-70 factor (ECF subfamily)